MLDLNAVSKGIITLLQELGTDKGNRKGPDKPLNWLDLRGNHNNESRFDWWLPHAISFVEHLSITKYTAFSDPSYKEDSLKDAPNFLLF